MRRFEQEGSLTAVKSYDRNNREPSLAYRYRIDRQKLRRDQVAVSGKSGQRRDPNALSAFARHLPKESARKLTEMLDQDEYIAQKVLSVK